MQLFLKQSQRVVKDLLREDRARATEKLAACMNRDITEHNHKGEWGNIERLQMFGGATSKCRAGCLPLRVGEDGEPLVAPVAVDTSLLSQFAASEKALLVSDDKLVQRDSRLQQAEPRNESLELDFLISCGGLACFCLFFFQKKKQPKEGQRARGKLEMSSIAPRQTCFHSFGARESSILRWVRANPWP